MTDCVHGTVIHFCLQPENKHDFVQVPRSPVDEAKKPRPGTHGLWRETKQAEQKSCLNTIVVINITRRQTFREATPGMTFVPHDGHEARQILVKHNYSASSDHRAIARKR